MLAIDTAFVVDDSSSSSSESALAHAQLVAQVHPSAPVTPPHPHAQSAAHPAALHPLSVHFSDDVSSATGLLFYYSHQQITVQN